MWLTDVTVGLMWHRVTRQVNVDVATPMMTGIVAGLVTWLVNAYVARSMMTWQEDVAEWWVWVTWLVNADVAR